MTYGIGMAVALLAVGKESCWTVIPPGQLCNLDNILGVTTVPNNTSREIHDVTEELMKE